MNPGGQVTKRLALLCILLASAAPAIAQEQSRESMANDSTAAQWSFQLSYEANDWHKDVIDNMGNTRAEGRRNQVMFRLIAPLNLGGLKILPRVTLRNIKAKDGSSGRGNAELFGLIIPFEWATGRFGIGPQVNFPAETDQLGSKEWRYGFATAVLQRAYQDKILTGVLLQQVWGKTDQMRPDEAVKSPITIQPIFNYAIANGYYVNIGETAFTRDYVTGKWLIPLGFRFGKLFINDTSTWNLYGEYRTNAVYKDWPGSAMKHAVRVNLSYSIPVG